MKTHITLVPLEKIRFDFLSDFQIASTLELNRLASFSKVKIEKLVFLRSLATLLAICLTFSATGQRSYGGEPLGLSPSSSPTLTLERPNYDKWVEEDASLPATRFAGALPVDFSPATHGEWQRQDDGSSIWQMRIKIPDALGLAIFYDDFQLAPGSRLFVYTPDQQTVFGAYTPKNHAPDGRFWTGYTPGEEIVIEYQAPAGSNFEPFHIWRIDAVYQKDAAAKSLLFGYGSSSPCHDNINCAAGTDWQEEKTGVARIIVVVAEGSGYCTGTLLNNTAEDGRLLFMSAFHCMDGFTPLYDMWRFDFGYEGPDCPTPGDEPGFQSILGSTYRAGRQANDFLLLELNEPESPGMQFHFAGWDRTGEAPDSAAVIHHPLGDIQKIALSTSESTVFGTFIDWDNDVTTPADHHYLVRYSNGTIELGSSGAALFDKNHRVIGHLHGSTGNLTCDNTLGYFGRLSMAWEGGGSISTRLRDWLDPIGTDTMAIDALGEMAGLVQTDQGAPINGVFATFMVNGVSYGTTQTGPDGIIPVPEDLPNTGVLSLTLGKDGAYLHGVSTFDIVLAQKQILAVDTLETAYRTLACDVNKSGGLSTLDVIKIRKVILNVDPNFGTTGAPPWQFYFEGINFTDPTNPWENVNVSQNLFTLNLGIGFKLPNFIGMKSGDANGSASPD